jgi:hypothetical protein
MLSSQLGETAPVRQDSLDGLRAIRYALGKG